MIGQVLMASYDAPLRVVDAADFDGVNDVVKRNADLTGNADGKKGIVSFWFRMDGSDGSRCTVCTTAPSSGSGRFFVFRDTTNRLVVLGYSTSGSTILQFQTAATHVQSSTWKHFLASWDLAVGASAVHAYINDVSDKFVDFATNADVDYTGTDFNVGAYGDLTAAFNGCLADLYVNLSEYLDFSLVANRRKFISASGKPVHLGTDGSLPTGTAPLLYLHLDDGEAVASFATNRGTGGNFSITGTLDTASSSPSD